MTADAAGQTEHPGARRRVWMLCASIALLSLVVFAPALHYPFINFDDPDYVYANGMVRQGLTAQAFAWAWTSRMMGNWNPLTWLSLMAVVSLRGVEPHAQHAANLALHAATAVMIFLFFARTTAAPWRSAAVAALFVVHPQRMESVVWIAERKDVLAGFFFALGLLAYARWVRQPTRRGAVLVLLCQFASLASKPMMVTFPVVLLLLDIWPLRRITPAVSGIGFRQLVWEKWPLALLSAALIPINFIAQQEAHAVNHLVPLWARLRLTFVDLAWYVVKTAWPSRLSPFYPLRTPSLGQAWLAFAGLAVLTGLLVIARRRFPAAWIGWFWYLVTIFPVSGIVILGSRAVADRYSYIPQIGLLFGVAFSIPNLERKLARGMVAAGLLACIAAEVAFLRRKLPAWSSSKAFFTDILETQGPNSVADGGLAAEAIQERRLPEAEKFARRAVERAPVQPKLWIMLEQILLAEGRTEEALQAVDAGLKFRPRSFELLAARPSALLTLGRAKEAEQAARAWISAYPLAADAYDALGLALGSQGRDAEALHQLGRAARLDLRAPLIRFHLAVCLANLGRRTEALRQVERALQLDPGFVGAADLRRQLLTQGDKGSPPR